MGFIFKNELRDKGLSHIIDWDFTNEELKENKDLLMEFLHRLGFESKDELELVVRHDSKGFLFHGIRTISYLEKTAFKESFFIGQDNKKKFLQWCNEHGYGVYFAISGYRNEHKNRRVRVHAVDYDKSKEVRYFPTIEEAEKQESVWKQLLGTEFEKITIAPTKNKRFSVTAKRPQKLVKKYKEEWLKEFQEDLSSAIIVETKNGYHAYWVMNNADERRFKAIQEALIRKFGTDAQITDMARILRVPYFFHMKDVNDPFFVEVIQWGKKNEQGNWITYTQDELIETLNLNVSETTTYTDELPSSEGKQSKRTKESNSTTVVATSSVKFKDKFDDVFSNNQLSYVEFIEEIKQIPFHNLFENEEFESMSNIFCCHFHNDEKPSATLYEMNHGHHVYHCFSDNCGRENRTVIDIYIELFEQKNGRKISFTKAIQALAKKAGVKLLFTPFQQEKIQELTLNLNWIATNLECRNEEYSDYPVLYKYISKQMKKILKEMIIKLLSYPLKEEWIYEGKPVLFMSYDYLSEELGLSRKLVMRYVNLLSLLGLITKMHQENVPAALYRRFEGNKTINYYCVPVFDDVAHDAEKMVEKLKEIKFLKTKIGFEYIVSALGIDIAKKVFPNDSPSVMSVVKSSQKATGRKRRKKVDDSIDFMEKTAKEAIRKKKYIKESILLQKVKVHEFTIFSKEEGQSIQRTLMDKELESIYEQFKVYFTKEGYKRVTLSKKTAKTLNINPQKPGERIFVWIKNN